MKRNKIFTVTLYVVGGTLLGHLGGQAFLYYKTGVFNWSGLFGTMAGAGILLLALGVFLFFRKKKGIGDVPLEDERSRVLLYRFHFYALFSLLILLSLVVILITFLDVPAVSVRNLQIGMMAIWSILGLASLFVMRCF